MFALVLFHHAPGVIMPEGEITALRSLLAGIPGLFEGLIFTPSVTRDAYVDDGAPPALGMQLHFAVLETLEAAASRGAALQGLGSVLPSLAGAPCDAQAFWCRTWPVPDPRQEPRQDRHMCSYVVHYPGPADDPNAWLDHYIASHPPLFKQFPGIRGIEILTPVDWVSHLPHAKVRHMQRNRVTFDSPEALAAALKSPVRDTLRADFHNFPPFRGGSSHYPMLVETLHP
jgi:uncharacterized protein (TIGR02118 family)